MGTVLKISYTESDTGKRSGTTFGLFGEGSWNGNTPTIFHKVTVYKLP